MTHLTRRWVPALALVVAAVSATAAIPSTRAGATRTPLQHELRGSSASRLDPTWNAQQAYQYMGRRPDKTYTRLGLPCAAWFGGWVKDRDP